MKYFFKHLNTVNKHRWEVFKLCCKAGIPFRGLVHDLSKFSYEEFSESVKYYKISNGEYSPLSACKKTIGYSKAWLHHFGRNKHHFEYWYDYTAPNPTPVIPYKYAVEMICDRIAASKIYRKEKYTNAYPLEYFSQRKDAYKMNKVISNFVEEILTELSKKGEKVLNKKHLKKVYAEYIK